MPDSGPLVWPPPTTVGTPPQAPSYPGLPSTQLRAPGAGPLLLLSLAEGSWGLPPQAQPYTWKVPPNCLHLLSLTPKLSHNLPHSMDSNPVLSAALAKKKKKKGQPFWLFLTHFPIQEQMDSYFKTYPGSNHCLTRTASPLTHYCRQPANGFSGLFLQQLP